MQMCSGYIRMHIVYDGKHKVVYHDKNNSFMRYIGEEQSLLCIYQLFLVSRQK